MRSRILPGLMVALLSLSATSTSHALGNRVWIDCKHGTTDLGLCESAFADAIAIWNAEAAAEAAANGDPAPSGSVVDVNTTLDYDALSTGNYRLLIITQPNPNLNPSDPCYHDWGSPNSYPSPWCEHDLTMTIPLFLSIGGRLVILADNDSSGEAPKNNGLRELLASIPDVDIEIGTDNIGTQCLTTSDIVPDALTTGLSSWKYAQTNTLVGGDPLIRYEGNGSTQVLAAADRLPTGGEVVVVADVEGFWTADPNFPCLETGINSPFWRNLYLDSGAAVDDDGDGHFDGDDCNDTDPDIHPGANEDCDNGVDDDCDGDIDSLDEECGGDDDDATSGDDDDSFVSNDDDTGSGDGGGFDDDDTESEWDSPGASCSCSPGNSANQNPGWLLALLALLALRRYETPHSPRARPPRA